MGEKEIVKCKYAGDKEDEFCCSCNGIKVTLNGEEHPATHCAGYEPETSDANEVVETKTAETSETSPETTSDTPGEETVKEDKVITEKETAPNDEPGEAPAVDKVAESENAEVTELCFSSGISKEINGVWYKFTAEERRVLSPTADPAEEREKLWAMVNNEVDLQMLEAIKFATK